MAKVIGTKGNLVNVQFRGIEGTITKLAAAGIVVKDGADLGVVKAASFIQEEVKESIAGNRVEHKSVDTGLLIDSIEVERPEEAVAIIKPKRKVYPGTNTTTEEVATIIEFSPNIKGGPRSHFRNTEKRKKQEVRGIIDKAIRSRLF